MARKDLKKTNTKPAAPFPFDNATMPKPKVMPKTAPPAQEPRPRSGLMGQNNLAKAMAGRKKGK